MAFWFGASALALGTLVGQAEARVVRYTIDGQSFSYNSKDKRQIAEARRRIEAADTANLALAKAEAEIAGSPLVKLVGSTMQSEAAQAQARLQQVMSETSKPARKPRSGSGMAGKGRRSAEAKAEPKAMFLAANNKDRPASARAEAVQVAAVKAKGATIIEPDSKAQDDKPALKAVTFDLGSGIKTVQMTDGTIHEEPLDSSTASKLGNAPSAERQDLNTFVEQLRSGGTQR